MAKSGSLRDKGKKTFAQQQSELGRQSVRSFLERTLLSTQDIAGQQTQVLNTQLFNQFLGTLQDPNKPSRFFTSGQTLPGEVSGSIDVQAQELKSFFERTNPLVQSGQVLRDVDVEQRRTVLLQQQERQRVEAEREAQESQQTPTASLLQQSVVSPRRSVRRRQRATIQSVAGRRQQAARQRTLLG